MNTQESNPASVPASPGPSPVNDGAVTLNRYAVAVATRITIEGKHWYSNDRELNGMSLYFIPAPDAESAEAIAVQKDIKYRRAETPGAEIKLESSIVRKVPAN